MYLNTKENPWKAAIFWVINLNTNKIIPHVQWANDETGEYAQYVVDEFNEIIYDEETGEPLLEIKKGNIKLKEKNDNNN